LPQPLGSYSHVCRVKAQQLIFVAGQLSVDENGNVVGKNDLKAQMRQVFKNLGKALAAAGADFSHVTKFTTFLVHSQDLPLFHELRKEIFAEIYPNGNYPPNTLLIIDRLVQQDFLIEVEAIAALP